MQGDTVKPGTPLRVRAEGAPGATLRVLSDHEHEVLTVAVTSPSFTSPEFTAPAKARYAFAELYGDDRQAERMQVCALVPVLEIDGQTTYCRNRVAMLAVTSAMYFKRAALPPLP